MKSTPSEITPQQGCHVVRCIPTRQAEAIAHARAIGEILRKDVTNCEEMMSLYFPII